MQFEEARPALRQAGIIRARFAMLLRMLWPRPPRETPSRLSRWLAIAGILLVVLILGGAAAIILDRRAAAYDAAQREATSLAVALAEQTSRMFQAAFLDLSDVVEEVQSKKATSAEALSTTMGTEAVHQMLRIGISGLSQISMIGILDADGHLLNSSAYWPAPKMDLSERDYFRAVRENPSLDLFVSPPVISRSAGNWTIYISRQLKAPDGHFVGVVSGAIELVYFESFYRAIAEDNGIEVSLWRQDGTLLARYPAKENEIAANLYNTQVFDAADPAAQAARSMVVDPKGPTGSRAATRAVKTFPLFVTVSRTEQSIAEEWRGQAVALGLGAVFSAGFLVLAIAALSRQIARREATETMLRQHRDNLEREVAERTKALAASEARHRDVAEVAGDWLWEIDAQRRFTFVSKRWGEATNIPPEDWIGKRIQDLPGFKITSSHRDRVWAAMDAHRSFTNMTSRIDFTDGRVRFWRTSGKPFFDPETGVFAGYRGSGTDVTREVEIDMALNAAVTRAEAAEEEARHARARLLDAIEALPAGFALWDADDKLELCNEQYREIYGKSRDLLAPGVSFETILRSGADRGEYTLPAGVDLEKWIAHRVTIHRSPSSFFEHRLADGRWIQVDERQTADGGVVGTRVDVTEAHKREASENERAKLAALGQLAGGVAHEINNLLQPAIIFPELVADRLPKEDEESRGDLGSILESARKARDIVKNILRFARKEEMVQNDLDLVAELKAALAFVRDLIPPTVALNEALPEAPFLSRVVANKTQLTQVLTNLIVNAAQAMKDHGAITVGLAELTPTPAEAARLEIEPDRPYLALSVSDTGCGMDAATQARIFEPFFTTKPVGQGTGLGLSVAYGILRSWNGAIAVTSAPGEGATFTLYIPITIAAA